jgi:hypothetical protein
MIWLSLNFDFLIASPRLGCAFLQREVDTDDEIAM